jgi:hypothetical protein
MSGNQIAQLDPVAWNVYPLFKGYFKYGKLFIVMQPECAKLEKRINILMCTENGGRLCQQCDAGKNIAEDHVPGGAIIGGLQALLQIGCGHIFPNYLRIPTEASNACST